MQGGIALVKAGVVCALITTEGSSIQPQLRSVSPLAAWCGRDSQLALDLHVSGIDGSPGSVLCGIGGWSYTVVVKRIQSHPKTNPVPAFLL